MENRRNIPVIVLVYQVCEKWLKDRRGRRLSYDDILHYQQITVALGDTIKAMGAIDEIIDGHGGWPIDV